MRGFLRVQKKPVIVEAICYDPDNPETCAAIFTAFAQHNVNCTVKDNGAVLIQTLEGYHEASPSDYIIRGGENEFYPCKPSIFKKTYEVLESVEIGSPEQSPEASDELTPIPGVIRDPSDAPPDPTEART